jgi:hypothetical protein
MVQIYAWTVRLDDKCESMDETKEGGKREVMERSSNDVGVRSSWPWAELWSDAVAGGDEEGESPSAEDVVSGTLCCSSCSFSVGGTRMLPILLQSVRRLVVLVALEWVGLS